MKAISILGTSSDAGKSWVATALCALLQRQGLRVAPFKAQNMSNNAYATLEGHEIGVAQAAQAEACGLRPSAAMNPILLKPMGDAQSQVVIDGKPLDTLHARDFYGRIDWMRGIVCKRIDAWRSHCDVLVMEGAGSPVELNLMERDLVNLFPAQYTDGRWLLVGDIERGGVFAQIAGTWQLLPETDRARGLGAIINRFRGDLSLFSDAAAHLAQHCPLPLLGTLPWREDLCPDHEDGVRLPASTTTQSGAKLVWVHLPHVSNATDAQPWLLDQGVNLQWSRSPETLGRADIIVIPGTKHTRADLQWLRERGLDSVIRKHAQAGGTVIGICGGYQILGETISDPEGIEGEAGEMEGLGLLPIHTRFARNKTVKRVKICHNAALWEAYEIHSGESVATREHPGWLTVQDSHNRRSEGSRLENVLGTYVHGVFEHPALRSSLMKEFGYTDYQAHPTPWREHKQQLYSQMASLLEEHLNLEPLWRYLDA